MSRAVVNEVVVIDIRNVRDISDTRIGDVHLIEETAAHAEPWDERFTKSQWAPTEASAETESEAGSPTRAAEPRDQRRRVVRADVDRTRRPSPEIVVVYPAAIMERSVSPRLVFNPGPSPGRNPDPMTVAIWRPSHIHSARDPNVPVFRNIAPSAVLVEVFGANDIGRNIAGGTRVIKAPIA